jgi:phosphoglycerate dehydrogenase-like enzyme
MLRRELKGVELTGKTLGIIGIGRIGREVAKRALGLGMKVIAYDPYVKEIDMDVKLVDLDTLYRESDYITVHVPLIPETRHMISKNEFEKMKNGVFVINCARGGIIDEEALLEALKSGKVAGAGLDVYETEPPTSDVEKEILSMPNVVATPHIGASTKEGQKRVGKEIVQRIFEELGI